MIADLDDVQNLLELSGPQLARAYGTAKPSYTVAHCDNPDALAELFLKICRRLKWS